MLRAMFLICLALHVSAEPPVNFPLSENMNINLVIGLLNIVQAFVYDLTHPQNYDLADSRRSPAEIVVANGFLFEEHKILTPDGYMNTAWRIPGRLGETISDIEQKPVAVLNHGLLDNSHTWLIQRADRNNVFTLAGEGYDVWLINARGNINSYDHINSS